MSYFFQGTIMQNQDSLFFNLKDKVPNDALLPLKESLDKASESVLEKLVFVNLKNSLLGLVLAFFLPGVDRIYKGDIVLGVVKLILFFGVVVFNYAVDLEWFAEFCVENIAVAVLFLVFMLALLVWFVVDLFLVYRGIKKDNLKKIFEVLRAS